MVTHAHIGFKVKDFADWKAGYDASIEQRKASGEISYQVFQNADDPNTVTVISVQKNREQVEAFMNSPDLHARMKDAGVIQMGTMMILEEKASGTH